MYTGLLAERLFQQETSRRQMRMTKNENKKGSQDLGSGPVPQTLVVVHE